jgi:hypothetical protein
MDVRRQQSARWNPAWKGVLQPVAVDHLHRHTADADAIA